MGCLKLELYETTVSKAIQEAEALPFITWKEVHCILSSLSSNDSGFLMEAIAKASFETEDLYRSVWWEKDIPSKVRFKLRMPKTDHGVDLLVETLDGFFYGVQVKFRSNENHILSWSGNDKLSNLTAHQFLDGHIVYTNVHDVAQEVRLGTKNLKLFNRTDLEDYTHLKWLAIFGRISNKSATTSEKFKPLPHQEEAIEAVIKGFSHSERGKLILPCRTGKTVTSIWIKERLKASRVLVAVPTLSLLRQFKNDWLAQRSDKFDYFCVCSERDIDSNNDRMETSVEELGHTGLGVTTDGSQIRSWLKETHPVVVFTTYQSLSEVVNGIAKTDTSFDLMIADEAHRTASSVNSEFGIFHDNSKLPATKRLYMTATPKIRGVDLSEKDAALITDMSNVKIFGSEFFRMSFRQAIDAGVISDYRIVVVGVTSEEVRKLIESRKYTIDGGVEFVASSIAIDKVRERFDISNIITFHSKIKNAESFQKLHQEMYPTVEAFTVSGRTSSSRRSLILKNFSESRNGILTNAKCLTEGVTIKSCDAVSFIDPKTSVIDIVQGASRCLNRKDGDKIATIVVPVFHDAGNDSKVDSSIFSNLIKTLRAMYSHDEQLNDEIQSIVTGNGPALGGNKRGGTIGSNIVYMMDSIIDRVGGALVLSELDKSLTKSVRDWDMMFTLLKEFMQKHGRHPYKDDMYKKQTLGMWFISQRTLYQRGDLDEEKTAKMLSIGATLAKQNGIVSFENMVELFKDYFSKHSKHPSGQKVFKGVKLGRWCSQIRTKHRKGKLTNGETDRLSRAGFLVNFSDDIWQSMVSLLKEFRQLKGRDPLDQESFKGKDIGKWFKGVRDRLVHGRLKRKYIREANELQFYKEDNSFAEEWNSKFDLTKQYIDTNGRPPIIGEFVSGYDLGKWYHNNLANLKRNSLSEQNMKKMSSLGLDSVKYIRWSKNYQNLKHFIVNHGRLPKNGEETSGDHGGDLRKWLGTNRDMYNNKKLSKERLELLIELGLKPFLDYEPSDLAKTWKHKDS